jgi:hypothetical protein
MLALRPTTSLAGVDTQTCQRPLDIVLIIDRSGSMDNVTDGKTRLGWANDAANNLVDALDANGGVGGASGLHHVGLTTYGGSITTGVTRDLQLGASDATAVHAAIDVWDGTDGSGNTPLRQGIADGADNLLDGDRDFVDGVAVLQVLILLSDGKSNPNNETATGAKPTAADITAFKAAADQTFGVAIGPEGQGDSLNSPDLPLMHALSNPDPANFFHVVNASDLPDLFDAIAEDLLCGDIHIDKTPDPAGPVDPGTSVTYTYDVTNSGDTPLINVVVTDNKCSPVSAPTKTGGDQDDQLEVGETWTYTCTTALTEDTTNQACANANFIGGGQDSACADATVLVTQPTPTPTPATPTPTPETPTPTPADPTPTPEGSVEGSVGGGTGTPAASVPDTAASLPGFGGPLATLVFGLILVASLGTRRLQALSGERAPAAAVVR